MGRAGGRVRCGACLEIFLAPDCLCGDGETAPGATGRAGGTGGIEDREFVGEGADTPQPGKQAANTRKGAGKDCSGLGEPELARDGSDTGWWVRWALVVAALILILQIVPYLT